MLHYEKVAEGEPRQWLYVLHGIFGAGRNWGSIIRRVVRERPEWGALLIDLRQHGRSQGTTPPHTVEAAARDLLELAAAVVPPDALLGHSFGGKVALLAAGLPELRERIRQVWVVDSTPDAREPEGGAWAMLRLLRSLPDAFQTRDQLVQALVQGGSSRPIAQWMATNLHHEAGAYRWRFDLDAMEDLLRSFFDTDAWPVVEGAGPGLDIRFVRASRGSVLDDAAVARVLRAGARAPVHLHQVEGGHWLNADNPDSVTELLVTELTGRGNGAA